MNESRTAVALSYKELWIIADALDILSNNYRLAGSQLEVQQAEVLVLNNRIRAKMLDLESPLGLPQSTSESPGCTPHGCTPKLHDKESPSYLEENSRNSMTPHGIPDEYMSDGPWSG